MIAYFRELKNKHHAFTQFIKFFLVGAVNTGIDFWILNFLIYLTGKSSGIYYTIFKTVFFYNSRTNSYFMNKNWTFKTALAESPAKAKEFLKFVGVYFVGGAINVGVATYVVNCIKAPIGISPILWANIGACASVVFTLTWNFLGIKFIVFKR